MPDETFSQRYPSRATSWQLRTRKLQFGRLPLLMGIVNVTPDSFSDGGKFLSHEAAVEQALKLAAEGADILDIGGESTRPYAPTVELQAELDRVLPVIEQLAKQTTVPISIDTSKSEVAQAALQAGTEIVNDVTALTGDPEMVSVVREGKPGVCIMHMQGTPQDMQDDPQYENVCTEVYRYLQQRVDSLVEAGVEASRICVDPGIGFGKTHEHNLELMASCDEFHQLGRPVLVGHSRKGFLGRLIGNKTADRTLATVGSAVSLALQGVQVIRVHDVRPVREALLSFEAVGGFQALE